MVRLVCCSGSGFYYEDGGEKKTIKKIGVRAAVSVLCCATYTLCPAERAVYHCAHAKRSSLFAV